jgi:hypothetical protein
MDTDEDKDTNFTDYHESLGREEKTAETYPEGAKRQNH